MAGYNGFSRSNNCEIALQDNDLITSDQMVKRIKKELGLTVNAEDIQQILTYTEKHHTSSYFNWQHFYEKGYHFNEYEIEAMKIRSQHNTRERETYLADVKYVVWTGSRNHPKATNIEFTDIRVSEKGQFYTFYTPNGDVKKKINSNGTEVTKK